MGGLGEADYTGTLTYTTIVDRQERSTPLWFAIAVLTGFSRVYLGVHYPGDVLSGAVSGTAIAEVTRWLIDEGDDVVVERNPLKRAVRRWL